MIGLIGGTFDPIHNGHIDVARAARAALGLDRVIFIPSRLPPHRPLPQAAGADRLAMVQLAIADEPAFEASSVELDADGPSYTSVTVARFVASGLARPLDLCFVAGADAFAGITTWRNYPALLDQCHFAVVSRPGHPAPAIRALLPDIAARMVDVREKQTPQSRRQPGIFLIDAPTSPVSSTDVRAAIDRRAPLDGLVPHAVAAYIVAHRLYAWEAHGR